MISHTGPPVKFQPGHLVRHKRYGYRGVVVDFDRYCNAPDSWYLRNRTQPDRNQPWYHVLVDASSTSTYAAQSSLENAHLVTPVHHPLVTVFFSGFNGKVYVRNNRPWPETWG